MYSKRVGIIGGGAAGINCAKNLLQHNHKVVLFESSSSIGGTWDLSNTNSSLYYNLSTNLPVQVMQFPDFCFSFPGVESLSFPTHREVFGYLKEYAAKFDVLSVVKFSSVVTEVLYNELEKKWELSYQHQPPSSSSSSSSALTTTENFDAIVVCNGHYSIPKLPDIPGLSLFEKKREVLHSHNYKLPEPFDKKKIVVFGAGASGVDISIDIAIHCPSSTVILSHHGAPFSKSSSSSSSSSPSSLPSSFIPKEEDISGYDGGAEALLYSGRISNLTQRPVINHIEEEERLRIHFEDETWADDVDVILFCTGYSYDFPFLKKQLERDGKEILEVSPRDVYPLYKHIFSIHHPSLSFVGLPWRVAPFPLFHYQTNFIASILSGEKTLPSPEEMLSDLQKDREERREKGLPEKYAQMMGEMQWEYCSTIASLSGQPLDFPIRKGIYSDCSAARRADPLTYRNRIYSSFGSGENDFTVTVPVLFFSFFFLFIISFSLISFLFFQFKQFSQPKYHQFLSLFFY